MSEAKKIADMPVTLHSIPNNVTFMMKEEKQEEAKNGQHTGERTRKKDRQIISKLQNTSNIYQALRKIIYQMKFLTVPSVMQNQNRWHGSLEYL